MKTSIERFKKTLGRMFLEFFACLFVILAAVLKYSPPGPVFAGNEGDMEPPCFDGDIVLTSEGEVHGFVKSVTVKVKAADKGSGLSDFPYSFDGGATWQSRGEYVVNENRTLAIVFRDREGNKSAAKTLDIVNIDNMAPFIGDFGVKAESGKWTVTVENCSDNVSGTDKLLYLCLTPKEAETYVKGGSFDPEKLLRCQGWKGDPSFRLDEGKYRVFCMDELGNISEKDLETGHIDTEPPVFKSEPVIVNERGSGLYALSVLVSVEAEDKGSGSGCLYSFDDGASWQKENVIRVENNTVLFIRAKDADGNVSDRMTLEINNIDREAPLLQKIEVRQNKDSSEICILKCSDNTTSPENLRFLLVDGNDAAKYKSGNGWNAEALLASSDWTGKNRLIAGEGNFYLFVKDELGNISEKDVNIAHLDKEPPVFAAEPALTGEGGGNGFFRAVLISVKAKDTGEGLNDYPYSFNNGETWQESGALRVMENKNVHIKLRDRAGNESPEKQVDINVIDDEAPVLTVTEGKRDNNENAAVINVKADDRRSGVLEIGYKNEGNGVTVSISKNKEGGAKGIEKSILIKDDGSYTFFARDFCGNIASKKIEVKNAAPSGKDTLLSSKEGNEGKRSGSAGSSKEAAAKIVNPSSKKGTVKVSGGKTSKVSTGTGGVTVIGGDRAGNDDGKTGSVTSSGTVTKGGFGGSSKGSVRISGKDTEEVMTVSSGKENETAVFSAAGKDVAISPEPLDITEEGTEFDEENLKEGEVKPAAPEESIPEELINSARDDSGSRRKAAIILISIVIFLILLSLTLFLLIKKGIIVLPEDENEDNEEAASGILARLVTRIKMIFPGISAQSGSGGR